VVALQWYLQGPIIIFCPPITFHKSVPNRTEDLESFTAIFAPNGYMIESPPASHHRRDETKRHCFCKMHVEFVVIEDGFLNTWWRGGEAFRFMESIREKQGCRARFERLEEKIKLSSKLPLPLPLPSSLTRWLDRSESSKRSPQPLIPSKESWKVPGEEMDFCLTVAGRTAPFSIQKLQALHSSPPRPVFGSVYHPQCSESCG
jgi:hypothetical protein